MTHLPEELPAEINRNAHGDGAGDAANAAGGGAGDAAAAENAANVALMQRVGQGDEGALRALITRWQGPLMNFFFRSLRNEQTSEDLTQLVFIRLHRAAPTYEPSARFSTYLFHIAHNLLLNEHRRASRKPAEPYDPALAPEVASGDDESARRVAEIEEAFAKAIEGLPANQRTAILLHKQQDLGYEEIAAAMGTSVTLVKTWLFRARVKLREVMKDA